ISYVDVLDYFQIAPTQLTPSGCPILSSLRTIYYILEFDGLTLEEIGYMYELKGSYRSAGYYYLAARLKPSCNLIEEYKSNVSPLKN
ncbi:hypothetical protein PanWU01x14_193930, partial [Parasponia andersonii]